MKYLILLLVTTLAGCSTMVGLADKGAELNDEALVAAEFAICNGASVGAIERRYDTKKLLEARKVICDKEIIMVNP